MGVEDVLDVIFRELCTGKPRLFVAGNADIGDMRHRQHQGGPL